MRAVERAQTDRLIQLGHPDRGFHLTPAQLNLEDVDLTVNANTDSPILPLAGVTGMLIEVVINITGAATVGDFSLILRPLDENDSATGSITIYSSGTVTTSQTDRVVVPRGEAPLGIGTTGAAGARALLVVPRGIIRLDVTTPNDAATSATATVRMWGVQA